MSDIIKGRYSGGRLLFSRIAGGVVVIESGVMTSVSTDIAGYEVHDERRRYGMGAGAAAAGAVLLGPVGLAAGAMGARKKRLCTITWTDGSQSVVEVKEPGLHRELIKLAVLHGARGLSGESSQLQTQQPKDDAKKSHQEATSPDVGDSSALLEAAKGAFLQDEAATEMEVEQNQADSGEAPEDLVTPVSPHIGDPAVGARQGEDRSTWFGCGCLTLLVLAGVFLIFLVGSGFNWGEAIDNTAAILAIGIFVIGLLFLRAAAVNWLVAIIVPLILAAGSYWFLTEVVSPNRNFNSCVSDRLAGETVGQAELRCDFKRND